LVLPPAQVSSISRDTIELPGEHRIGAGVRELAHHHPGGAVAPESKVALHLQGGDASSRRT
jgi:hypothetical protein